MFELDLSATSKESMVNQNSMSSPVQYMHGCSFAKLKQQTRLVWPSVYPPWIALQAALRKRDTPGCLDNSCLVGIRLVAG